MCSHPRGDRCGNSFLSTDCLRRPPQIDRVPQDDGGHHQVKTAGAIALVLETTVSDFAESVQKYGACQRVLRFPLVQSGLYPSAQLDVLHLVERKQRALNATQLAKRDRQAVLARIAAELPEHQR